MKGVIILVLVVLGFWLQAECRHARVRSHAYVQCTHTQWSQDWQQGTPEGLARLEHFCAVQADFAADSSDWI